MCTCKKLFGKCRQNNIEEQSTQSLLIAKTRLKSKRGQLVIILSDEKIDHIKQLFQELQRYIPISQQRNNILIESIESKYKLFIGNRQRNTPRNDDNNLDNENAFLLWQEFEMYNTTKCKESLMKIVFNQCKYQISRIGNMIEMQTYLNSSLRTSMFKNVKHNSVQIFSWDWEETANWIQEHHKLRSICCIFSQHRINGMEISLLTHEQMKYLAQLSNMYKNKNNIINKNIQKNVNNNNDNNSKTNKLLKIICDEVLKYRIGTVFEHYYSSNMNRIVDISNQKITEKTIRSQSLPDVLLSQKAKSVSAKGTERTIMTPDVVIVYDDTEINDLKSNNDNGNQVIGKSHTLDDDDDQKIELSAIRENIQEREKDDEECVMNINSNNQIRMCQIIMEIIKMFRCDPRNGIFLFWKNDAIFFNKIDNILAALSIPSDNGFDILFLKYFKNFLADGVDVDVDDKSARMHMMIGTGRRNNDEFSMNNMSDIGTHNNCTNHNPLSDHDHPYGTVHLGMDFKDTGSDNETQSEIDDIDSKSASIRDIFDDYNDEDGLAGGIQSISPKSKSAAKLKSAALARSKSTITQDMIEIDKARPNVFTSQSYTDIELEHLQNNASREQSISASKTENNNKVNNKDDNSNNDDKKNSENNEKKQGYEYNKNVVTMFWKQVCLYEILMIVGCIILIGWWYWTSIKNIGHDMEFAITSVKQRVENEVDYAFRVPVSILGTMITMLYTGDIPIDNTLINGSFNKVLNTFPNYDPDHSIYQIYVYNVDLNIILGSYICPNDANTQMWIFDGYYSIRGNSSCAGSTDDDLSDNYNNSTSNFTDYYIPTERPWFELANGSLSEDPGGRLWTDMYEFHYFNGSGVSLVEMVHYKNHTFVFVVEYNVNGLESIVESIKIPLNGVFYIANDKGTILATTADVNASEDVSMVNRSIDKVIVNEFDTDVKKVSSEITVAWPSGMASGRATTDTIQNARMVIAYSKNKAYLDELTYILVYQLIIPVSSVLLMVIGVAKIIIILYNNSKVASNSISHCRDYTLFMKFVMFVMFISIFIRTYIATQSLHDELIPNTAVKEEYKQSYNAFMHQITDNINMILSIVEERFYRGDMIFPDENTCDESQCNYSIDKFFISLMDVFTASNGKFNQFGIHVATPDGAMYGVWPFYRGKVEYNVTVFKRDNTTNRNTIDFKTTQDGYANTSNWTIFATDETYDPRCRPWYQNGIKYTFSGGINDAFPDGYDNKFFINNGIPGYQAECQSSQSNYKNLFGNDTEGIIEKIHDIAWTRYIFTVSGFTYEIGFSATKAIVDDNGKLLAVILIDYTLNEMSKLLYDYNDEDSWLSWLMEADEKFPNMLASSDSQTVKLVSEVHGLTCIDNNTVVVPYNALEHPNKQIQIATKLIFYVDGFAHLPINSAISKSVKTVIDQPYIEAGRIKSSNVTVSNSDTVLSNVTVSFNNSCININGTHINCSDSYIYNTSFISRNEGKINAILMKMIDVTDLETSLKNSQTVTFILSLFIFILAAYLSNYIDSTNNNDNHNNKIQTPYRGCNVIKDDWYDLLLDCSSVEWNEIHCNTSLITMRDVRIYAVNKAKWCLKQKNDSIAAVDHMIVCDECCLTIENEKKFNGFIAHNHIYSCTTECVIFAHVMTMFFDSNAESRYDETSSWHSMIIIKGICISIEWIDLLLTGYTRYVRFKARTETRNSKYIKQCKNIQLGNYYHPKEKIFELFWGIKNDFLRIFIGPWNTRFNCLCVVMIINTLDFVTMVTSFSETIFSKYLPILPLLLIFHSLPIYSAMENTIDALRHAYDVLILFATMLVILSIEGMALFQESLNIDTPINNYSQFLRSVVTTFLYITTGENYPDLVPSVQKNPVSLVYFFTIVLINMLCVVPLLILRFQASYYDLTQLRMKIKTENAINCICAAFIMLDIDSSNSISKSELKDIFELLVIDDPDATERFNIRNSNELELSEFVELMLNQHLVSKCDVITNRQQAYLECKVFSNPNYNVMFVLVIVTPVIMFGALYGLSDIPSEQSVFIMAITFCCCIIDVILKIYAFGIPKHLKWYEKLYQLGKFRYFNLNQCNNPPFVQWCIYNNIHNEGNDNYKYNTHNAHITSNDLLLIYLNSNDLQFCETYLKHNYINLKEIANGARQLQVISNYFDFISALVGICGLIYYFIAVFVYNYSDDDLLVSLRAVLLLPVLCRLFTLISINRRLGYQLIVVVGQWFDILLFAFLYIIIWARIGVTLFGGQSKVVLQDIYQTQVDANFDTLDAAVLSLLQMTIGNSWGEILYRNILATGMIYVMYFIIFVLIITVFIVNIFVALVLQGVQNLQHNQRF